MRSNLLLWFSDDCRCFFNDKKQSFWNHLKLGLALFANPFFVKAAAIEGKVKPPLLK
jgi:hypothetical protein